MNLAIILMFIVHLLSLVIGIRVHTSNHHGSIPERIIITYNDEQPTEYEREICCEFEKVTENKTLTNNILTKQLAHDLPKISVLTSRKT